jgi:hypothetical protein
MQQRWSIVKCLITPYRLNKGEYVVKEATMAKLKSTKVDEAIYSCLQMLEVMDMEEYP